MHTSHSAQNPTTPDHIPLPCQTHSQPITGVGLTNGIFGSLANLACQECIKQTAIPCLIKASGTVSPKFGTYVV